MNRKAHAQKEKKEEEEDMKGNNIRKDTEKFIKGERKIANMSKGLSPYFYFLQSCNSCFKPRYHYTRTVCGLRVKKPNSLKFYPHVESHSVT